MEDLSLSVYRPNAVLGLFIGENGILRQDLGRLCDSTSPARLLDVGCCFGQDLRKLVVDGVPSERLVGLEPESKFLDLGFELFADRELFKGQMIAGNLFDESPNSLVAA